jgi:peptidoglycan/LPS O-acetylase OafA/YrhL
MSNSAIQRISTGILTGRWALSASATRMPTPDLVEKNVKSEDRADLGRALTGEKSRSRFVDILRGIAVIGVMFHHFYYGSIMNPLEGQGISLLSLIRLSPNNGWLGVNLFFILSGLVLYRPKILLSKSAIREYYIARIRRLWPLYAMFIFFITMITIKDWRYVVFYEAFLLSGLHDLWPYTWMPMPVLWVLWSLGIEILFSIALPAILIAMERYGFWRMVLVIVLSAFLYRCVADQLYWALTANPKISNPLMNPLKDNILGRIDDFVIGMAAAKLISEKRVFSSFALITAMLCLMLVGAGWTHLYFHGPRTIPLSIFASALHPLFSVSILVLIVHFSRLESWNLAFFSPVVFFGTTCYSAYLVHAVLQKYCGFDASGAFIVDAWKFIEYILLTFSISAFLFVFVEASGIRKLPDWAARVLGR